jgi:hypothetical protein
MDSEYPQAWGGLKHPWTRRELLGYLDELSSPDPLAFWAAERRNGLVSGFDQIINYLFDDVVLDQGAIGYSLFDGKEVQLITSLKEPLEKIVDDLPMGTDEESASHPLWGEVRKRAAFAKDRMIAR